MQLFTCVFVPSQDIDREGAFQGVGVDLGIVAPRHDQPLGVLFAGRQDADA